MLKIGDFARLSHVPVKTLRYYDDLGLITPARVDDSTHRNPDCLAANIPD